MKKFFNWIKTLEAYQIIVAVFFTAIAFILFFCIPREVYIESITHYDINVTYCNGNSEFIHCDYYGKKNGYLYYCIGDDINYINLDLTVKYEVKSIECDCSV